LLYLVFTTGRCNLRCIYCGGSFDPEVVPWSVQYDVEDLKGFMEGDPEPIVGFYGGEPLLNVEFIKDVMDEIPDAIYLIQTNGLLVEELDEAYWRRFDTVLLSIDGRRETTDYYRGRGVYDRVLRAAGWLRGRGFRGDLIARMAISERSEPYDEITHLISLEVFDHVHWQLDAVWSDRWRDFEGWAWHRYLPDMERLIELWMREAERGRVLGLVPILGVLRAAILGRPLSRPPCGAGSTALAISTDGRVLACPIAVEEPWAELGDVRHSTWRECIGRVGIGEPCIGCKYVDYCGGRCLYAYRERLWGEEGFRTLCGITSTTIDLILGIKHRVQELLREGRIDWRSLNYPPYNNSTEIIP